MRGPSTDGPLDPSGWERSGSGADRLGSRHPRWGRHLVGRDLDLDLDLLADEPATRLERHVPVETPALAVDRRPRAQPEMAPALQPPGDTAERRVEGDRLRRPTDRQIAGDLVLIA